MTDWGTDDILKGKPTQAELLEGFKAMQERVMAEPKKITIIIEGGEKNEKIMLSEEVRPGYTVDLTMDRENVAPDHDASPWDYIPVRLKRAFYGVTIRRELSEARETVFS